MAFELVQWFSCQNLNGKWFICAVAVRVRSQLGLHGESQVLLDDGYPQRSSFFAPTIFVRLKRSELLLKGHESKKQNKCLKKKEHNALLWYYNDAEKL